MLHVLTVYVIFSQIRESLLKPEEYTKWCESNEVKEVRRFLDSSAGGSQPGTSTAKDSFDYITVRNILLVECLLEMPLRLKPYQELTAKHIVEVSLT